MVRRKNYLGFLKLHLITKHDILSAGELPMQASHTVCSPLLKTSQLNYDWHKFNSSTHWYEFNTKTSLSLEKADRNVFSTN